MDAPPTFLDYFREQGFVSVLLTAALAAGLYTGLVCGLRWLLRRWSGRSPSGAGVTGLAAALGTWTFGITLFEAAALYWRHDPPGSGAQRQGQGLERFYRAAELGFGALYAAVVVVAVVAPLLARRRSGERGSALTVSVAGTLAFLVLTLPAVEFQSSCDVGRPILVEGWADC